MPPVTAGAAPNVRRILLNLTGKADFGVFPDDIEFNGILGIAFHPRFLEGRQFRFLYVRYTQVDPMMTGLRMIIERFPVTTGLAVIDPAALIRAGELDGAIFQLARQ